VRRRGLFRYAGLIVCGGWLVLGSGGGKAPAKDARQKYAEGDFKAAGKLYVKACDAGDAPSCTQLGTMLLDGKGVEQNDAEAVTRFEQACDGGDPRGCLAAGHALSRGEGVARDDEHATKMFDQGCQKQHVGSCTEYAVSLWRGRGVEKDAARAKEMLAAYCKKRNAEACFNLGVLVRMGEPGVERNSAHAKAILDKACKLGALEACAYLEKHAAAMDREAEEPPEEGEESDVAAESDSGAPPASE
jgi:TPR repeat protein